MQQRSVIDLDAQIDWDWLFGHRNLFLTTREGLGDAIVAAGLASWMARHVEKVFVPCRAHQWHSIDWMYRRIPNIYVLRRDREKPDFPNSYLCHLLDAQLCKSFLDYPLRTGEPWFRACYSQYQLEYETRFKFWPTVDPGPRAEKLYHKLTGGKPYMIIHNTSTERLVYDIDILQGRSPGEISHMEQIFIDPKQSNNLFDWLRILEQANEIHVIDSSIFRLCEQLACQLTGTVYFHNVRLVDFIPQPDRDLRPFFPDWKIAEYSYRQ